MCDLFRDFLFNVLMFLLVCICMMCLCIVYVLIWLYWYFLYGRSFMLIEIFGFEYIFYILYYGVNNIWYCYILFRFVFFFCIICMMFSVGVMRYKFLWCFFLFGVLVVVGCLEFRIEIELVVCLVCFVVFLSFLKSSIYLFNMIFSLCSIFVFKVFVWDVCIYLDFILRGVKWWSCIDINILILSWFKFNRECC